MQLCGIICEFNPFHNGHKYLLKKAAGYGRGIICIMSGSFVQRGEAAIYDKWTRARAALENGADLVAELPAAYVLSSAEQFAYGGVSTLDMAGADCIVFGSECGDISRIAACADMLLSETDEVRARLRTLLRSGLSYPDALCRAYENEGFSDILKNPNNILGVEYIRAIKKINSHMKAYTVKRCGAGHDSAARHGSASGMALREMLANGEDITQYTPYAFGSAVRDTDTLSPMLLGILRTRGLSAFENIPDVCEGIENRILSCASHTQKISELIDAVKTKRYTRARLSRLMMNIMLNTDKKLAHTPPTYLRVLGMNQTGAAILKQIKQMTGLEIITKLADFRGSDEKLALDIRACDLAALCDPLRSDAGTDYTTSPVILK